MKLLRWSVLTSLMLWMGVVSATPQDLLQVEQTLSKTSMAVQSCQGESDTATVTITLQGRETVTPIDLVVVMDRSSSEDLSRIQDAAKRLLAQLNQDGLDRVALVSFSDTARLDQGLSSDAELVESAIENLSTGQLTALGDGLALALSELTQNGRTDANKGIVVLSDGGPTTGLDPLAQAEQAAQAQLPLYFVGMTEKVNRGALSELARRANGAFFASANTQSLVGVLKRLGRTLLADFITINETLPDALTVVGIPEGMPEAGVSLNARSGTTELTWTVDTLLSGQVWQAQFEVSASQVGKFLLSRHSELSYFDAQGARIAQPLPNPQIEVTGTPPPIAQFIMNPIQPKANQFIQFLDRSTTQGSTISSWTWEFGDGETSSEQNPMHVYDNIGTYSARLTITDSNNCTVSYENTFRISEVVPGTLLPPMGDEGTTDGTIESVDGQLVPVARILFGREEIHAGIDVSVSIDTEGVIQACAWDFGDGTTSDQCEFTHQYAVAGTYTVSLTLTFENGQTRTLAQTIEVLPGSLKPTADFTFGPSILRPRQPVAFDSTAASVDEDGTITAWIWDFGDGNTSEAPNPVHEFERPGTYEVSLTVTDNTGEQSDTVTKEVTIGLPVRAFADLSALQSGIEVPEWMKFYIDGGVITDEELEDAARRFANGSFVQSTQYRLTEADLRALTELHDLRIITSKYLDPEDAVADGYVKARDFVAGFGQDYVHIDILNGEKPPEFDQVPILIYAPNDEGVMELAGVRFVAFDESETSLFGIEDWPTFAPPPPRGAPPGGGPRTIFVLTVWIWRENPDGMFAPANPSIQ